MEHPIAPDAPAQGRRPLSDHGSMMRAWLSRYPRDVPGFDALPPHVDLAVGNSMAEKADLDPT